MCEKERCENCDALDKMAEELGLFFTERGFMVCNVLIVIEKDGCRKSLIPACNLGIVEFTIIKITEYLARIVTGKATRDSIKEAVTTYLNDIKKDTKP